MGPGLAGGGAGGDGYAQQEKRLDDFNDIDSMYSAYDNWHRGMIISRSASATFPGRGGSSSASDRMQERGEGSSLGTIADEKMFQPNGGRTAVPFYKTLLSNLSTKSNQTYTVNEE